MQVRTHVANGFYGLTILHFSDVHFSPIFNRSLFLEILNYAKEKHPDYICISGDLIDHAAIIEKETYRCEIEQFLKHLGMIAPVLYGLGNHEVFYYHQRKKEYHYEEAWFQSLNQIPNVSFLDRTCYEDDRIFCYGLTLPKEYYEAREQLAPSLPKTIVLPEDKTTILLCHSPSHIMREEMRNRYPWLDEFHLILEGHMHRGMVFPWMESWFPENRGLIAPSKRCFFPKYARGTVTTEHGLSIISGGVTKLSSTAPRVLRSFNQCYPPEMEWIEVREKVKHR